MRKIVSPVRDVPEVRPPAITTEFVSTMETIDVDGRPVTRQVLKEVEIASKFEGLKVSDFSMESLSAAGALDSLVEVRLLGASALSADSAISLQDALVARHLIPKPVIDDAK